MDEVSREFDLSLEEKTRLLELGLDSNIEETEQNRGSLLVEALAAKLPLDPAALETLPFLFQLASQHLKSVSGSSIGDLIRDPKTEIVLLQKIKEFGKRQGASARNEVERDVALAVYYAAIAHALVNHNVKISRYSQQELAQSFEALYKHDWLSPDVRQLFERAQDLCRKEL